MNIKEDSQDDFGKIDNIINDMFSGFGGTNGFIEFQNEKEDTEKVIFTGMDYMAGDTNGGKKEKKNSIKNRSNKKNRRT